MVPEEWIEVEGRRVSVCTGTLCCFDAVAGAELRLYCWKPKSGLLCCFEATAGVRLCLCCFVEVQSPREAHAVVSSRRMAGPMKVGTPNPQLDGTHNGHSHTGCDKGQQSDPYGSACPTGYAPTVSLDSLFANLQGPDTKHQKAG